MKKAISLIMSSALILGISVVDAQARIRQTNYVQTLNTYSNIVEDSQSLIDARKAYLDSLVKSGYITQEQADLDIEQYKSMLEYRKSQVESIDIDSLVNAQKAYLDSLVKSGYITQEQADLRLSQYKSMLEYRQSVGYYNYGHHGYGGCGMYGYGHHGCY